MSFVSKFVKKRKRGTKRTFKNLLGRKSTVKERKNVCISSGLHGLLKRHAQAKGVYLEELVETFVRDGLMRAEGWERPEDFGAEFRKARQIIEDNTSIRLSEEVLEAGCPPPRGTEHIRRHPPQPQGVGRGARNPLACDDAVRFAPIALSGMGLQLWSLSSQLQCQEP